MCLLSTQQKKKKNQEIYIGVLLLHFNDSFCCSYKQKIDFFPQPNRFQELIDIF